MPASRWLGGHIQRAGEGIGYNCFLSKRHVFDIHLHIKCVNHKVDGGCGEVQRDYASWVLGGKEQSVVERSHVRAFFK